MYNKGKIQYLADFIAQNDGVADKKLLASKVQNVFCLTQDRSVFYCNDFAIRFCKAKGTSFSNTVLSLSALQKYDRIPFIVCLVTPYKNYLMMANTTFLRKISHSSQELRKDNIRGSFNGSDIIRDFDGKINQPGNFEYLFSIHDNYTFSENLERLVEATNNIQPAGKKFIPNSKQYSCIMSSVMRAEEFLSSDEYMILKKDLQDRVNNVSFEIVIASFIENVNLRGRIIEYLITSAEDLRSVLVDALRSGAPLPEIYTSDDLGDYYRDFGTFCTKTDIKTKILFLSGNPKGYNIDKLLSFLASEKSVYMIYIIAIDEHRNIYTQLCSMYNRQILSGTRILTHWAGRNSRGVTQYNGKNLEEAVFCFDRGINIIDAENFIYLMMNSVNE